MGEGREETRRGLGGEGGAGQPKISTPALVARGSSGTSHKMKTTWWGALPARLKTALHPAQLPCFLWPPFFNHPLRRF